MKATDIREDAYYCSTIQEAEKFILENLDYSEFDRKAVEGYEEWRAASYDNRKERSDKGKAHKAPNPEDIEFAKTHTWPEAKALGWSNTKYYRYKKM